MALLQIAEPGLAAAPHQHRLAVGIDLGTTNSLVASVKSGHAVCLADAQGRKALPSVVRYGSGSDIEPLSALVHPNWSRASASNWQALPRMRCW